MPTLAADVEAELTYAVDTGEKLINETMETGDLTRIIRGPQQVHNMTIRDGRVVRDQLSIDAHGFELADHPTAVPDFFEPADLEQFYFPEIEALVLEKTGAERVYVFDRTVRNGDEDVRQARQQREPVKRVHNDYTDWSGPRRLRELLPGFDEALLQRRFAIVQVWRATHTPIEIDPLCMCDARTVAAKDLLISERRYPDRIGQTYRVAHNPAHEWYWFPRMTRDEALVFKVYDSATDGCARFTPHTSFDNPLASADAPPRRSIEVRAFAIW